LNEWKSRTQQTLLQMQSQFYAAAHALEQNPPNLFPTTRRRLEILCNAYKHNIQATQRILSDFSISSESDLVPEYKTLSEKLPGSQRIDSYSTNLFRDWAWEGNENQKHFEQIKKVLPNNMAGKNIVVLGAGSCRLALDIHLHTNPKWTLAVDINPYLLLAAKKILEGEEIHLYDFPLAPFQIGDVCPYHECKSNTKKPENFHYLFADGMNPPFQAKSIDCVITPWFIDIVPQTLGPLTRKINNILKEDGVWINFGPLGFNSPDPTRNLCIQEIEEIMQDSGFTLEVDQIDEVPYLQTPHSGQKRTEKVYSFQAKRTKSVKSPPRFTYLPEWILNPSLPIPKSTKVEEHRFRNQVYFEVLKSINGEYSINDLELMIQQHYKMTEEQAKVALYSFFIQFYEAR